MSSPSSPFGTATALVDDDPAHPYVFVEHTIDAGHTTPYLIHPDDQRSYIVIEGSVDLDAVDAEGRSHTRTVERLSGWHAPAGGVFRIHAADGAAVLVEAGTRVGTYRELPEPPTLSPIPPIQPVSSYTVDKPWGHEVWYGENLEHRPYALKQIHMTAGNQSSLQSHREKSETNYVIDGEAKVLNGLPAPNDPTTVIDVERIPAHVHKARSGWSSAPGVLHRVIAQTDYTSIEVSTPQLDDVIRWQDDTGRGDGRVETEHQAAT